MLEGGRQFTQTLQTGTLRQMTPTSLFRQERWSLYSSVHLHSEERSPSCERFTSQLSCGGQTHMNPDFPLLFLRENRKGRDLIYAR